MKWRSLLFLFACMSLLLVEPASGQKVSVKNIPDGVEFTCSSGTWKSNSKDTLTSKHDIDDSTQYECSYNDGLVTEYLTVKIRTCENCIELDSTALCAIIVGNILATAMIGYAVYSIIQQPKSKTFSGNKASDKVNLITNGEGDTYQRLTPGQSSEYSGLVGRKK